MWRSCSIFTRSIRESVRFNVAWLQSSLRAISGAGPHSYANEAERLTGKLHDSLVYDRIQDIFARGPAPVSYRCRTDMPEHRRADRLYLLLLRRSCLMNRYRSAHVTQFTYDAPVTDNYNEVRLRPLQDNVQSCLSFRLTTDPPAATSTHFDF